LSASVGRPPDLRAVLSFFLVLSGRPCLFRLHPVDILCQRRLDFGQLPALGREFIREGKGSALAGAIGGKPTLSLRKPMTGALLFFIQVGQNVFELRDRTERRCGDGQFDFRLGTRAYQPGGVAIAVLARSVGRNMRARIRRLRR
jgi:hypothetical protein